jgi:hypothetical protein
VIHAADECWSVDDLMGAVRMAAKAMIEWRSNDFSGRKRGAVPKGPPLFFACDFLRREMF